MNRDLAHVIVDHLMRRLEDAADLCWVEDEAEVVMELVDIAQKLIESDQQGR